MTIGSAGAAFVLHIPLGLIVDANGAQLLSIHRMALFATAVHLSVAGRISWLSW